MTILQKASLSRIGATLLLACVLAMLCFASPVCAQNSTVNENGWKFLSWGMTPDQVKQALADNGQTYSGVDNNQQWFWYGFDAGWNIQLYNTADLPEPDKFNWVASGIEGTDLLFYDGKLFGVIMGMKRSGDFIAKLYKSMIENYPGGKTHQVDNTNMLYFQHKTDKRYIVWQSNSREFGLCFYDIKVLNRLTAEPSKTPAPPTPTAEPETPVAEATPSPSATPAAVAENADTWTDPATGMTFIRVPGGCYMMGQTKDGTKQLLAMMNEEQYRKDYFSELPRHKACVDEFWLAAFEVTNKQYRLFDQSHDSGHMVNQDEQPVANVSRADAEEFAKWLTAEVPRKAFRLPTEAEWEYAARAGTETVRYFGDDPNTACEYENVADASFKELDMKTGPLHQCDDGHQAAAPVGSLKPNPWGFYDMLGNVSEWCEDSFGDYFHVMDQEKNPINVKGYGSNRAVRGGSWSSGPAKARSAFHMGFNPSKGDADIGFRLIMVEDTGGE